MSGFTVLKVMPVLLFDNYTIDLRIYVTGSRFIYTHFYYCLAVEAGFYSDVVECLPVDPATWTRFPAGTGTGKIFSLCDI